jgi:hypothetical protein
VSGQLDVVALTPEKQFLYPLDRRLCGPLRKRITLRWIRMRGFRLRNSISIVFYYFIQIYPLHVSVVRLSSSGNIYIGN